MRASLDGWSLLLTNLMLFLEQGTSATVRECVVNTQVQEVVNQEGRVHALTPDSVVAMQDLSGRKGEGSLLWLLENTNSHTTDLEGEGWKRGRGGEGTAQLMAFVMATKDH